MNLNQTTGHYERSNTLSILLSPRRDVANDVQGARGEAAAEHGAVKGPRNIERVACAAHFSELRTRGWDFEK